MQHKVEKVLSHIEREFNNCSELYFYYLNAFNTDGDVVEAYSDFCKKVYELKKFAETFGLEGKFFEEIIISGKLHNSE